MDESGDKITLSFPFIAGKALIAQLIEISEEFQEEGQRSDADRLCGWQPDIFSSLSKEIEHSNSKNKNSSPKENSRHWKVPSARPDDNPYKEVETVRKASKKRGKYHPKRLEELSVPRKIRNKVTLTNRSKMILPFNDRNAASDLLLLDTKIKTMTKIALKYQDPENIKKGPKPKKTPSVFRTETTHSAGERSGFAERSFRELLGSKSYSAGSFKFRQNHKEEIKPSILVKTRANAGMDWDMVPIATEVTDEVFSESSITTQHQDINLPLPRVKLNNNNKSNKKTEHHAEFLKNLNLPPIPVPAKAKRPIGSVTAITQGNIKAGIKSNSIRKIRRPALPQTTVILPKLSGSKVEVPLLPKSPDFLHRII